MSIVDIINAKDNKSQHNNCCDETTATEDFKVLTIKYYKMILYAVRREIFRCSRLLLKTHRLIFLLSSTDFLRWDLLSQWLESTSSLLNGWRYSRLFFPSMSVVPNTHDILKRTQPIPSKHDWNRTFIRANGWSLCRHCWMAGVVLDCSLRARQSFQTHMTS